MELHDAVDQWLAENPLPPKPSYWQARATAAEAENARLREALATVRDYVADASTGALIYVDSGAGYIAMAKEDLARVDAALESRNVG